MQKARINDIDCILFYDERVQKGKTPEGYPNIYHVRHAEENWTRPVSIEKFVFANFFGTIFTKELLKFDETGYIEIKHFKIERKYINFYIRKETIKKIFNLELTK